MENSFQTSFIPKKPMTAQVSAVRSPTSIVTILAVVLLVGMGLVSGGLYFYKIYLTNQRTALSQSLTKASASFDLGTVSQLELFDKRATVSQQILNSHIILSPLFALLGQLTIPSIQYTKFEHKTDSNGFSVSLAGIAHDYKSIAMQANAFNTAQGSAFKNVVFSNLTKDVSGNVEFNVDFTVDPSLLSYSKNPAALSGVDMSQTQTSSSLLPTTPVTNTANTPVVSPTPGVVLPQPTSTQQPNQTTTSSPSPATATKQ